jgi:hypothetical protein
MTTSLLNLKRIVGFVVILGQLTERGESATALGESVGLGARNSSHTRTNPMEMRNTSCCAIQEIAELRQHETAQEAMFAFCRQNIVQKPKFQNPKVDPAPIEARGGEIFCFYLFTANVDAGQYGQNFAKFIEDNKLGTVVTTEPRSNRAYHGEQRCQAWIWTVDQAAIKAWWAENKVKARGETPSLERIPNGTVDSTRGTSAG